MHTVTHCPICGEEHFINLFSCKDYTVSKNEFTLEKCLECELVFTNPRPTDNDLGEYYLSAEYISHTSKTKTVLDLIYKTARVFTLNWKYSMIKQNAPKVSRIRLLDYGCGTGDFLKKCLDKGTYIEGVEPSALARQQANQQTNNVVHDSLSKVTNTFHAITLWHVLEHVPDLDTTLHTITTHLEKNGTVFIAVPNHRSLDAQKYKEHWAGYDVPRHLWHFSQNNMTRLLAKHGLSISKIIPMKLDSFYVSMLSEKYINGKMTLPSLLKAINAGLESNNYGKKTTEYSSLIYIAHK